MKINNLENLKTFEEDCLHKYLEDLSPDKVLLKFLKNTIVSKNILNINNVDALYKKYLKNNYI